MTTAQQLAIVSGHVDDAVSKGARVLVGGKSSDPATAGLFYQPTVLVDVDHGMTCMREETFGPTLPVMKVRDVAEAIEKANDSRLGLSGSVWTRDKNKAMALARKMNTGIGEHQQRHHGRLPIPLAVCGLERIGAGFALRRGRRDPQILPHQKHCGRPGCDEKGTALVSLQPQEGQDPRRHAPDDVGQRLAATARAVAGSTATRTRRRPGDAGCGDGRGCRRPARSPR